MHTSVLSMPSDPLDPRFRAPRSPACPNDISQGEGITGGHAERQTAKAGLCGLCAWGFYTMTSPEHQTGEPLDDLTLTPVLNDVGHAGYKAQCGRVKLYRDLEGRVGAVRLIQGEERFFAGIRGNWAFERYARQRPELQPAEAVS